MRKIITFLSLLFCLFATAQEVTDTMYIYRNDKIIERIPVSKIDSVVFVAPKAPAVPDVPETPVYEAIDLGLPSGVKWAIFNVGATKPEEYGGYYAWGEIEEKDDYSWSTYKWCNGTYDSMTKYCTNGSYGTLDNKTVLEPEDDVAHVKWGGNWRMPTTAEQYELLTECTWTWTTLNGVNGYQVTGPNGNSIFLPAAGYREGAGVKFRGDDGRYWSSSLDSDYGRNPYILYFYDRNYCKEGLDHCFGLSVRPVCSGTTVPVENYTVSVSSDVNGTVSIEGTDEKSITVSADETVTVTATPADGYKFVGWFVEGVDAPISTYAAYTFAVTANISLVAKFEKIESSSITYEAIDLGLPSGLKWATCNVGASSPEEYGGYYAWGEIDEKADYSWSTYKWCNGSYDSITKYYVNFGLGDADNKTVLEPEDDVAHVKWGDDWRMPTFMEIQELLLECTWTWTTLNGVNGYRVTGPNGNSIFLPVTGVQGYWSSTLASDSFAAWSLYLLKEVHDNGAHDRCSAFAVRPVCDGK